MLYTLASDFGADGTLRPVGACAEGKRVLWDRRLFPGVRRRVARHVHTRLQEGLHGAYVDAALIGRRWHPSEARTFAEVAKLVLTSAPLDAKEEDPVSRMAADTQRVHMATLARKHDAAGVRGAQDAWAQAAYQREQAAATPGAATRLMAARAAPRVMLAPTCRWPACAMHAMGGACAAHAGGERRV